jgi:DNA-binding MarR family transcriptional regulator
MSTRFADQLRARKGFKTVEQEVFLSILYTADLFLFEVNQLLKPSELTSPGYNVLRILRGAGNDGLPCAEISARMHSRDPDITRLVDRLVKRRLVRRRRQESDRRVVMVSITTEGLDLLGELDGPVLELHRQQLGHLGRKRLGELVKFLEAVRDR